MSGKTLEVCVVVEDRGAVILGDGGHEVIKRRHAQVLMRGAELDLQLDGPAFGPLGEPQQRKLAGVDRGEKTTCARLEYQRGARRHETPRDPVGYLTVPRLSQ